MVIRPGDRVSSVIGHDESLVDVFVALSPAFERLRSRSMRKVMARLVTVEQAARMAGIDSSDLVARLNAHIAGSDAPARAAEASAAGVATDSTAGTADADLPGAPRARSSSAPDTDAGMPAALRRIPPDLRVELDVREELRAGREPFSQIMAARRDVPPGGAFAVRATFEPVPLYAVMRRQGLAHFTEQFAADDWRVWFFVDDASQAAQAAEAPARKPAASATDADAGAAGVDAAADETGVVVLDVRGLEPPEPMVRTLAALETLPAGGTLVQMNVRVPQFLLPLLEQRGFTYEIREQAPDLVRVFIRHGAAETATIDS